MEESQVGVRKNIQVLQPNQRKQFFWCLKMLGIIPPFEALKSRYFISRGIPGEQAETIPLNKIQPQCLHDELIANHSTCCEHHNFYFAYFHRHLMFHYEMRLNYADECLRLSPDQFKMKFQEIYKKSPKLWQIVLSKYKQMAPNKNKVMAHYWNPTNFNNRDDLVIPIELADPNIFPHGFDQMDELYFLARDSYPYEICVRTRWHNNPSQYDSQRDKFPKQFRPFNYIQENYSEQEKKIVRGQYSPRQASDLRQYNKLYNNLQDNTMRQIINHRNKTKWDHPDTLDRINLNHLSESQFHIGFGGRFGTNQKEYNMHYFNQKQCKEGQSLQQTAARVTYNEWTPHYCFGFALFNQDSQDLTTFLESKNAFGLDRAHDLMHVHMKFVMSDAMFSDSNLLFFLYHSWIDLQLEMKIRMCHNLNQGNQMYNRLTKPVRRAQRFDILLNPDKLQKSFGAYPMFEWANPYLFTDIVGNGDFENQKDLCRQYGITSQQLIYYFNAFEYMMKNQKQLRTSVNLKQFYNEHYIPKNTDNYKQFKGFGSYDAGYDFEVFETVYNEKNNKLENRTNMLQDFPNVFIPQYLTDMKDQVNQYFINIRNRISKAIKGMVKPKSIEFYQKLIKTKMLLLIRFSSSVRNGTHNFYASFEQLIPALLQRQVELSEGQIQLLKGRNSVLVLPIFGREEDAKNCINCGQSKYKLVNMDQQFYVRFPKIWNFINSLLLQEVVYDRTRKKTQQKHLINVNNFIDRSQNKHQFQLTYINGAAQVTLEIIYKSDSLQSRESLNIQLSLDVARVQNGELISSLSKQITSDDLQIALNSGQTLEKYRYRCQFYEMRDMNTSLNRNDLDRLVYKQVRGNILVGKQMADFVFDVKNYNHHIRYTIFIQNIAGQIKVKVVDSDYELKREVFRVE